MLTELMKLDVFRTLPENVMSSAMAATMNYLTKRGDETVSTNYKPTVVAIIFSNVVKKDETE